MRKLTIIILAALISGFVVSCKKALKPYEGVKTVVNYDLLESTINFQFVDAATGDLIGVEGDEYVNLSYFGDNKDLLLDMTGSLYDVYKSDQGFVINAVHPNFEITETTPFKITAVASAPGYISNTEQISVYEKGESIFVIPLVKISSPPQGVDVENKGGVALVEGGVVKEEAIVNTPNGNTVVTIPQGIKMYDKDGNALSGSLKMMVAHFDNMSEEALSSFPGGLMGTASIGGQKKEIVFESAGFMAIEITDENGNKAAQFENGSLQLEVKLNPATVNPETGSPLAVGDIIPLFSLNEETGEWLYEKDAVVILKDGELVVDTEVEHLSYWNLDWWYSPNCGNENTNARIKFIGNPDDVGNTFNVRFTIRRQSNGSYMKSYWKYATLNQEIRMDNVPRGIPVYFEFLTNSSCGQAPLNFNPNPLYIDDLCASDLYSVNVSSSGGSNIQDVTINVEGFCPNNPDIVVYPTYSGWVRPNDEYCWQYVNMVNGVATAKLDVTRTYIAGTYTYNGWYQSEFQPDTLQATYVGLEMPAEICSSY